MYYNLCYGILELTKIWNLSELIVLYFPFIIRFSQKPPDLTKLDIYGIKAFVGTLE
jgi:hypothetical protein